MEKYSIYRIVNPLGQVYIGQAKTIKKRFSSYKSLNCKQQRAIYNSLLKFGVESHIFQVLFENDFNKEEVDNKEIELISLYKNCNLSLNLNRGGSKAGKGRNKAVLQFNFDGTFIKEWSSIIEIEENLNISSGSISGTITQKLYYCKNFHWIFKKDYYQGFVFPLPKHIKKIKYININLFDLKGNYIKTFFTAKQASKELNIPYNSIRQNLNGKYSKLKNYIFSFESSVENYFHKSCQKVGMFDLEGNLIREFSSKKEASLILNVSRNMVNRNLIKSKYNFRLKTI